MNEAMQRLKWKAFQKWLEEKEISRCISEGKNESIADDVTKVCAMLRSKRDINDNDEVKSAINPFIEHSANINHLMHDFTIEGCSLSYTFWDTYANDLSQLLPHHIAPKQDWIRGLEVVTFTEILPYDWQLCFPLNLHAGGLDFRLYDGSDLKTYLLMRW